MPNSTDTKHSKAVDQPPISALFLIDFDVKAGYTIAWKRAESGLEIEGLVEYKSLPSGLHTVSDDLIYFVHDVGYAGLSAFVNEPCEEEGARHARMIAVGVLVPLSYGRLGRAWKHAEALKRMAALLAKDRKDTATLEEYWQAHKAQKEETPQRPLSGDMPLGSPSVSFSGATSSHPRTGHGRNRSVSDGAALAGPERKLSPYHPAWSLTRLLDRFGPLIFPIHRAALLRKRILISCQVPVHEVCNDVYNISILSNIPLSVTDLLPTSSPTQRLQPLFAIGVHDIPLLMEDMRSSKRHNYGDDDETAVEEISSGWIACTTDSILTMKKDLWDVLITIPPAQTSGAKQKIWPTMEGPNGHVVKATQRDLRRFQCLRAGLKYFSRAESSSPSDSEWLHKQSLRASGLEPDEQQEELLGATVEPVSWSALAYNGFMWWASAGEQLRSNKQEELARDTALLADLDPPSPTTTVPSQPDLLTDPLTSGASDTRNASHGGDARVELAIIAYFHRFTTQMLSVLADIYEGSEEIYTDDDSPLHSPYNASSSSQHTRHFSQDSNNSIEERRLLGEGRTSHGYDEQAEEVKIDSRSVETMGLDVWSGSDNLFIHRLMELYFGRKARVEGKSVEVCGIRVC